MLDYVHIIRVSILEQFPGLDQIEKMHGQILMKKVKEQEVHLDVMTEIEVKIEIVVKIVTEMMIEIVGMTEIVEMIEIEMMIVIEAVTDKMIDILKNRYVVMVKDLNKEEEDV
jgi:hypothetical protein